MIKKAVVLSLVLCLALLPVSIAGAHTENTSYSWYYEPRNDLKQPRIIENNGFIDRYNAIYLGNPQKKRLYLTFDAGYENGNVEKIAHTLHKHGIQGTFFILPHFLKKNPQLVTQMIEMGHVFGNHSETHRDMSKVTDFETFKGELTALEDYYRELTQGQELPKYYRPPEGIFSEQNLEYAERLGYRTVFWSLAYADWDNNKQMNPQKALELVLSRIHNGCVLLLHPTSSTNAMIMDELITRLKADGYEFGSLDEFSVNEEKEIETIDYQQVVVANRHAKKRIAITFDDGPHKDYTPKILDMLKEYDAKATFFIVGKNAQRNPELLLREHNEGHEIGNHTYSHPSLRNLSLEALMEEIDKTNELVFRITGESPCLFRPPGGYLTDTIISTLSSNDYTSVLWSWRQDTRDWRSPSVESVVNTVLENLQDGDIILFHDYNKGGSPTPKALGILLPKLKEMGYILVTVSELMKINPEA